MKIVKLARAFTVHDVPRFGGEVLQVEDDEAERLVAADVLDGKP